MITEFKDSDAAYLEWVFENPKGLVINCRRKISPEYMILHSSRCPLIVNYKSRDTTGGFTERGYIKVCSNHCDDLRKWVSTYGATNFSKTCSVCMNKKEGR